MLLDIKAVAKRLGVNDQTVWGYWISGQMPGPIRIGRCVRWRAEELRMWILAGCPTNTAALLCGVETKHFRLPPFAFVRDFVAFLVILQPFNKVRPRVPHSVPHLGRKRVRHVCNLLQRDPRIFFSETASFQRPGSTSPFVS